LASSEITLVQDIEGNRFACKETRKKRLPNSYFHEFIKNEMVFQYSLSKYSDNIVKVLDYYEDENSYFMVMEYSYQPTYFEDLLENVHKFYFIILNSNINR
jgi:serine/threonine protein kinase